MLEVDEIIQKLQLQDANLSRVAKKIGVPKSSVYNLVNRRSKNAYYLTVKALSDYLEANDKLLTKNK